MQIYELLALVTEIYLRSSSQIFIYTNEWRAILMFLLHAVSIVLKTRLYKKQCAQSYCIYCINKTTR